MKPANTIYSYLTQHATFGPLIGGAIWYAKLPDHAPTDRPCVLFTYVTDSMQYGGEQTYLFNFTVFGGSSRLSDTADIVDGLRAAFRNVRAIDTGYDLISKADFVGDSTIGADPDTGRVSHLVQVSITLRGC